MHEPPTWAPRLERSAIARLYRSEACGLLDEALLDDIAYGMYARALSLLEVTCVHSTGRVRCPVCGATVCHDPFQRTPDMLLTCACGWAVTWAAYFKTYHRKGLVGGAAAEIVQQAADAFPVCKTPAEKMRWVDNLIHAFHGQLQDQYYRPVASNFINGNVAQIVELIDTLAYGEGSPEERKVQGDLWKTNLAWSYVGNRVPG